MFPVPQVIGKFSIRIVPNQEPAEVQELTRAYLRKRWAERGSANTLAVRSNGDRGWVADFNNDNFTAGAR